VRISSRRLTSMNPDSYMSNEEEGDQQRARQGWGGSGESGGETTKST